MKTPKLLLQAVLAMAALTVPAVAQAQQPYPYPQPGYQPMLTPLPMPGPLGEVFAGTPLDPYATTVHVVPPTGGTVMLYRDNSMRGWWMQEGLISVKPDMLYSLVATRGTNVVFASGIVFRPGYTEIIWRGDELPQIAYQPTWPMYPGYGDREPAHARRHHDRGPGDRDHAADVRAAEVTPSAPVHKPVKLLGPKDLKEGTARKAVKANESLGPATATTPQGAHETPQPVKLSPNKLRKPAAPKKPTGAEEGKTAPKPAATKASVSP